MAAVFNVASSRSARHRTKKETVTAALEDFGCARDCRYCDAARWVIFTAGSDFQRYAKVLPLKLQTLPVRE